MPKIPLENSVYIQYAIQIAQIGDDGKIQYYDDLGTFETEKQMRKAWKVNKYKRPRYQMMKYTQEVMT